MSIGQLASIVSQRICPLSGGCPTVFYGHESFVRACEAKQATMKTVFFDGKMKKRDKPEGRCGQCLGLEIPAEIKIKEKGEVMVMASSANKQGRCELCDEKSALRSVHDLKVCGKCQVLLAHVNNRIELVIAAIRHLKPKNLAALIGEVVSVGIENDALDLIAEAVGYDGDSGPGLIEAVKDMVNESKSRHGRMLTDVAMVMGYKMSEGSCQGFIDYINSIIDKRDADGIVQDILGRESLKRIAKIVGYAGDDREELIEAIRETVSIRQGQEEQMRMLANAVGYEWQTGSCQGFIDHVAALKSDCTSCEHVAETRNYDSFFKKVTEALGMDTNSSDSLTFDGVIMAVMHNAALLEDYQRDTAVSGVVVSALRREEIDQQEEIDRLRELLGVGADVELRQLIDDVGYRIGIMSGYHDICEKTIEAAGCSHPLFRPESLPVWVGDLKAERDRVVDQLKKLDDVIAFHDQIFAAAADELQVPGLPPGELVPQIKSLRAAAGYYSTVPLQIENFDRAIGGPSIELAIGGLNIKIHGLPVNQACVVDAG